MLTITSLDVWSLPDDGEFLGGWAEVAASTIRTTRAEFADDLAVATLYGMPVDSNDIEHDGSDFVLVPVTVDVPEDVRAFLRTHFADRLKET